MGEFKDDQPLPAEELLVTPLRRGNPNAQHEFARQLLVRFRAFVINRVGSDQDAEDVLSIVSFRAITRIEEFDPQKGTLWQWVSGIVRHAVVDLQRARERDPDTKHVTLTPLIESQLACVAPTLHADSKEEEPESGEQGARLDALRRALKSLAPRDREFLELQYALELAREEIAAHTGVRAEDVRKYVHRARGRLRTILASMPEFQKQPSRAPRDGVRVAGPRRTG